jgi:hypothetical protein
VTRAARFARVLLAVLPLCPVLVFILRSPWLESSADDDVAILEIGTLEALSGKQLVGPYSRFNWNHPGPAEFYVLAPPYLLGGRRTGALGLGALLVNAVAAGALVWVSGRLLGGRRGWWTLLLLAGFLAHLGPAIAGGVWNPYITLLPFALFLFLAAGFALKGTVYLPAAILVGSFVVQTHIGYAPAVAVAAAAALWERLRAPHGADEPRRTSRLLVISGALLAVVWFPPLLEQVRNTPGNLTLLARFLRHPGTSHGFAQAFGPVSLQLGAVPLRLATLLVPSTSDQKALGAGFLTLFLVALLPLARARAVRHGDDGARVFGTLGLAGLAAAFFAILRIRGDVHDYLVLWISATGLFAWAAAGAAILGPEEGAGRKTWPAAFRVLGPALVCVVVALAAAGNARRVAGESPVGLTPIEPVRALTRVVRADLARHPATRPLFVMGAHDTWPPASGLFLELRRAGVAFSIEEDWWPMFGRSFRPDGREDRTIALGDAAFAAEMRARGVAEFVGEGGGTYVFAVDGSTPAVFARREEESPGP